MASKGPATSATRDVGRGACSWQQKLHALTKSLYLQAKVIPLAGQANIFSVLTYAWLSPLMTLG